VTKNLEGVSGCAEKYDETLLPTEKLASVKKAGAGLARGQKVYSCDRINLAGYGTRS